MRPLSLPLSSDHAVRTCGLSWNSRKPCCRCRVRRQRSCKAGSQPDQGKLPSGVVQEPEDVPIQAEDTAVGSEEPLVEWWAVPPSNQSDPPRQSSTAGGAEGEFLEGNFVVNDLLQSRSGKVASAADAYDIPTVKPVISYVLLAINLAVYGWGVVIALTQSNDASNDYFLALAKSNEDVVNGEYYRLLTANFLHAGLLHLGLNCAALASVGPEAEAVLGYGTFAAVYLLCGLSGSLTSFLWSDSVTVGASGAIFGLLGALGGYFLRNRELQNSTRQLLYLGAVAAFNLVLGASPESMIDNSGHIGGLLLGLWLGFSMGPRFVVLREVDIPEGSMLVPADAAETRVVVDQNNTLQRGLVFLSVCALLVAFLVLGVTAKSRWLGEI